MEEIFREQQHLGYYHGTNIFTYCTAYYDQVLGVFHCLLSSTAGDYDSRFECERHLGYELSKAEAIRRAVSLADTYQLGLKVALPIEPELIPY